ncbi:MAG: sigma-54-dependent Fis family transcriptional regulator [Deltaproteobacteria bacterium]|nr:sigma-54-dependent Fis family transcriptional regulator [Deltaproteobacteria bacterium]
MNSVLIVEGEKAARLAICRILQKEGFNVIEASNGKEAVDYFKKNAPLSVILDLKMPVMGGIDTIDRLKSIDASVPIIVVTGLNDAFSVMETMRLGAYDFITKPVEPAKLVSSVKRGVEKLRMEREAARLTASGDESIESIFGRSPAIRKAIERLKQVAATDFSVIIEGETGTGKTFLAKAMHNMSKRAGKAFVKIDMGAIPLTLMESELFGYEKGAFTGASFTRKGFFESADGGSIFIDELENAPPIVQSKLLGVVEDKAVYRIGSRRPIVMDIRIIAATSADIQESITEERLREDLFYRMGEFVIKLPPLRERTEDIMFFAGKFLEESAAELGQPVKELDAKTIDSLTGYHWPGNIRELKNVIRRAALLSGGSAIKAEHLELSFGKDEKEKDGKGLSPFKGLHLVSLRDSVSAVEKEMIIKALESTKNNKAKAASILRIDTKTLRSKIQEYGIESYSECDVSADAQ